MKGPTTLLALLLVAGLASADVPGGDPVANPLHGDVPFLDSLADAGSEAAWRGKPLLVFYCLKDDGPSLRVAETAFRDAAIVGRAAAFVPALVDADADERFGLEHGVKTVPTILLLDLRGKEAGRVSGAAGPAEILRALEGGLERIGPAKPPKEARDLERAAADLEKARAAGDWRAALKAVVAVERIGHPGPESDAAAKARVDAGEAAATRLAAAKKLVKDGKRDEGRTAFRRIAKDFAGLDAAVEATNLLKEMDGPAGDGGDGGGGDGGGDRKEPKSKRPHAPHPPTSGGRSG